MNTKTLNILAVSVTVLVGLMVVIIINTQNNKEQKQINTNFLLSHSDIMNSPAKTGPQIIGTSLKVKNNLIITSLEVVE